MKRIDKLQIFNPKTMQGTCTLLFDKAGLKIINMNPNAWKINGLENKLCNKNGIQQITITSLCNHHLGSLIKLSPDYLVTIEKIEIKRLGDITESEAVSSEIECIGNNTYKHYCPEKFFSKSELATHFQGTPYFESALGSFHSLWMKKYGVQDVVDNPWIWQYTVKYNKKSSERK
jgi:hypothetical protein